MVTQLPETFNSNLYEADYYLWLQSTVEVLNEGQLRELDVPNLIEEIESMGRRERRAVYSNLKILLFHLLKYQFQPEKRSNSWKFTIREHRQRLHKSFQDSPSLKRYFDEILVEAYQDARALAADETGCEIALFPLDCPSTPEAILDPDYLPENAVE